ncbi:MAG: spermidine synthase [Desulfomonile tiedjei]|nr:spermidine synthase [Desulfomonile tiedjei]
MEPLETRRSIEGDANGPLPKGTVPVLICAMFFLSGMSALIFENLWFRLAGLAFGNSVWATSLVLSSFMGGLALGNGLTARYGRKIANPIRFYGLMEIVIAVTGVGLVIGFPPLTQVLAPLFRQFLDQSWILNPLRLGIAFLLLMGPATAMGTTLPLLVKALSDRGPHFGVALGRLYGWNTLGAVAGALLPEAILIEHVGVAGAGWVAFTISLIAACSALALARVTSPLAFEWPGAAGSINPSRIASPRSLRLLAAGFLSGGIVLALEVVWFRFLVLFFNAYSIVFAVMLAVVLAGIGLGGMLASWNFRMNPSTRPNVAGLALITGVVCVGTYVLFGWLPAPAAANPYPWAHMLLLFTCLIFPVCLLSGVLFTFIGDAVFREIKEGVRTTGLLTMINTTGAMLGALIGGFVLLPVLGMEQSFFLLAASYGVVAVLSADPSSFKWREAGRALTILAAAFVITLACFPFGSMRRHIIASGERNLMGQTDWKLLAIREGLAETSQYWQRELLGKRTSVTLFTNNHPMSGTRAGSRRYMQYFVYLPVALHADPKDALLICYGVGATAKALTETRSFKSIEVVDISKDILENSRIIFPDDRENPLNDPRVRVHVEDGRFYLNTSPRQFDLITAEPPPPLAAGVVNLYSREYFRLIYDRLRPGGFVTYWLPVGQIPWSGTKSIVKAFCSVFDDCSMWTGKGLEWVLMGVRRPFGPSTEGRFSAQWQDEGLQRELRTLGFETPELFGSTFIMDAAALRKWTADTAPLVDNYPYRIFGSTEDLYADDVSSLEDVMRTTPAREIYRTSPLIEQLWPPELRERTLGYFRIQNVLNEAMSRTQRSMSQPDLDALHLILTTSSLKAPILWIAGGSNLVDDDLVLDSLDPDAVIKTPGLNFHLGVRALADRDYVKAHGYFVAEERVSRSESLTLYRAYCLCMARRTSEAEGLLKQRLSASPGSVHRGHLEWLHDTFGINVQ